jgi:hypothetical protein
VGIISTPFLNLKKIMALKTKANIKTALDNAAADLTLAFADTVSGIAAELKDNNSALRKIHKLFDISESGVVTVNADKYNALFGAADAYRGKVLQGSGTILTRKIS